MQPGKFFSEKYVVVLYNVMQLIERGTMQLWAFLGIDESIQKIIKKTIRFFFPFFNCKI